MLTSRKFDFQRISGQSKKKGILPAFRILPSKKVGNILLVPFRALQWLVYFVIKALLFILNFLFTFMSNFWH